MKIFTHNFNPNSNSGPNKFSRQLFQSMIKDNGVVIESNNKEADVEFCLIQQQVHKVKPMLLRLDGIWFNSEQDYDSQNAPIKYAYGNADAVVFQSNFNKALTEKWFGEHRNSFVIHNAPDLEVIKSVNPRFFDRVFGVNTEVWSCASKWRPHKRLNENIRYFFENAPKEAVLAVAGPISGENLVIPDSGRVYLLGDLDYVSLLSLYRRSSTFIHLSYLDHCPNVVVDAQASGCHIICSSTGGTKEIVSNGTIIHEKNWDYSPIKLYEPPAMDFKNKSEVFSHQCEDKKTNIVDCANLYYNVFKTISSKEG